MISPDQLGIVADDLYIPLDEEVAGLFTPEEIGVTIPGLERFRPYAIEMRDQAVVVGITDQGADVSLRLADIPGLRVYRSTELEQGQVWPHVTFEYYKDGEVDERLVALYGFAYGVHQGHRTTGTDGGEEAPSLYVFGRHLGSQQTSGHRTMLPSPQRTVKSFSLARVVHGPLGDPRSDTAFRERMRIPEVKP